MDKSYKKPLLLITFGVILFAAFNNLNYVANFLKSCIGLLAPILSGLLLAFVLSVPVRGLAKRLRRKLTKATDRQIDMISLLLTLICVIAIIALILALRLWTTKDEDFLAHSHDDLPADHDHVVQHQVNGVHVHEYVIDDYHQKWPK